MRKRRVRHLAVRAQMTPDEALIRLRAAGVPVVSINDQISRFRLDAAIRLLLAPPSQSTPSPATALLNPQRVDLVERSAAPHTRTAVAVNLAHPSEPERRGAPPRPSAESVEFLTESEVLAIHFALVEFFARESDPITPSGPRDKNLLASALLRPRTSIGEHEKYRTVPQKAAALFHSLVKNHPFHNGNKRTALVGTLAFLDRNGWHLRSDVSDDEIFCSSHR